MKNRISIILFLLLTISNFAQDKYTISGYVQDESSGENLIGVSIYDKETYRHQVINTDFIL